MCSASPISWSLCCRKVCCLEALLLSVDDGLQSWESCKGWPYLPRLQILEYERQPLDRPSLVPSPPRPKQTEGRPCLLPRLEIRTRKWRIPCKNGLGIIKKYGEAGRLQLRGSELLRKNASCWRAQNFREKGESIWIPHHSGADVICM